MWMIPTWSRNCWRRSKRWPRKASGLPTGLRGPWCKNLKVMARMGVYFEEEVQRRYPEFPTRRGEWSWEDYLPPMSASLRQLVAAYS